MVLELQQLCVHTKQHEPSARGCHVAHGHQRTMQGAVSDAPTLHVNALRYDVHRGGNPHATVDGHHEVRVNRSSFSRTIFLPIRS